MRTRHAARRRVWRPFRSSAGLAKVRCALPHVRRLGIEPLEDRRLLSAVTLVTHGFGADVEGWVREIVYQMRDRAGHGFQPLYKVEVTDPGHDRGILEVVNIERTGPSFADKAFPEIIILLDWSDLAGELFADWRLGGYHRSTVDVASALAEALLSDDFLVDLSTPAAELPLHLIGHSRGASLVGELARNLGEAGVWVDQVTTLDPHPVDGVREPWFFEYPNWHDAPMIAWDNVVFWDNYWRTDGPHDIDFTGESIANVFDRELSEGVLFGEGHLMEHSDVHLWYHGTVDTVDPISDGDVSDFYAGPAGWYGGSHPSRTRSGYYYSRVVGGNRPADGLARAVGGNADRSDIDFSNATWPSIVDFRVDSDSLRFTIGQRVRLSYYYQDTDSDATITFYLDVDKNPYNNNESAMGDEDVRQSLLDRGGHLMHTYAADPGAYYVLAAISDGDHTRYAYAPERIVLESSDPPQYLEVFAQEWSDDNSDADRDGVVEGGERGDVRIELRNVTTAVLTHVDATLTCDYPGVEIIDARNFYETIWPGDRDWGTGDFAVQFNLDSANDVPFVLEVDYEANDVPRVQYLEFSVDVPRDSDYYWFEFSDIDIDDSPNISSQSDGDRVFESGERVHVRPRLCNRGDRQATDVLLTLSYDGPGLEPFDRHESYPDLNPAQCKLPLDSDYFRMDAPGSFAGCVRVQAQVEWDQGDGPFVIPGGLEICVAPAPYLFAREPQPTLDIVAPGEPAEFTVRVGNPGSDILVVSDVLCPDDTSIVPETFALAPGEDLELQITVRTDSILENVTTPRELHFVSNAHRGGDEAVTVNLLASEEVPLFQVPTLTDASNPDIAGSWIVWQENRSGDPEDFDIFAYNVVTGQELVVADNGASQRWPKTDGRLIAWTEAQPGDGDLYDVWCYDLETRELFAVAADPLWDERLVGVDGAEVTYQKAYYQFVPPWDADYAYNLWIWDPESGPRRITHYEVGTEHTDKISVRSGDFGGGGLVWEKCTYRWFGDGWRPQEVRLMKDGTPVVSGNVDEFAVDDNRIIWSDEDANGDDQVFLWENGSVVQITPVHPPEEYDHGDEFVAIGDHFIVYDKYNSNDDDDDVYYYDLNTGQEYVVASWLVEPGDARMDSNGLVLEGDDPGSGQRVVYFAFLQPPDLSLVDLGFSDENPFEGDLIDVSVTIHNESEYLARGPIDIELFDGDPDSGGVPLASDTIDQDIAGSGDFPYVFYDVTVPDNRTDSPVETHRIFARVSLVDTWEQDTLNNTVWRDLTVHSVVPGWLGGMLWKDINEDCVRDPGEDGLFEWTVELAQMGTDLELGPELVNPNPNESDRFGLSVAWLGENVLVGAMGNSSDDPACEHAGAVFLYDGTTGDLLHTFPNPDPDHEWEYFGYRVAGLDDMVIAGTPQEGGGPGAVHVFDSSTEALLGTIDNPSPGAGDFFGGGLATWEDSILVTAESDNTAGTDAGAVYLLDASTLEQLPLPLPEGLAAYDRFGYSIAARGDKALVGAIGDDTAGENAGAVYLFDRATEQWEKILHPEPTANDQFGTAVGFLGDDLLVGTFNDDAKSLTGAVYVLDGSTGEFELLRRIDPPVPGQADGFGAGLTAVGPYVLVSAIRGDVAGNADAGIVYLFDGTTGELLSTQENPHPEAGDNFGGSLAASEYGFAIGAPRGHAGSAYLFRQTFTFVRDTKTNANGFYDFADIKPGTYRISVIPQEGWSQTCPGGDGTYIVTVEPGDEIFGLDFGFIRPEVIDRHIFYNGSAFDWDISVDHDEDGLYDDCEDGPNDDEAIAPDKEALLPRQTASFRNYTSYSKGINGIMVDIACLPPVEGSVDVDEYFTFKVGNTVIDGTDFPDVAKWDVAPEPSSVTVREGAGSNGSDRVTIIWPDNVIQKQWLRVTVLATENSGLAEPDVFYFGNAIGESGNSTTDAKVNAYDMLGARDNQRTFVNPAEIDFPYDYDRDARVNAYDMLIARDNQTHFLNALKLITVPASEGDSPIFAARKSGQSPAEAGRPAAGFGRLDWLCQFDERSTAERPSRPHGAVQAVVDQLLAGDLP